MRDPFAGYDQWLERPYQDMMEDSERFVDWAEEEGYDLEDVAEMNIAEQMYEAWLNDSYESEAEAQAEAEAYLDRMEYEAQEEDEYFDRW